MFIHVTIKHKGITIYIKHTNKVRASILKCINIILHQGFISNYFMRVMLRIVNMNIQTKHFQSVGNLVEGPIHPFKSLIEGFINFLPQSSHPSHTCVPLFNLWLVILLKSLYSLISGIFHFRINNGGFL